MKTDRRQRGWLTFELVVILLLIGMFVLPAIVANQSRVSRNVTRDKLRSEYVDDFSLFYRAVRSYIPTVEGTWAAGSRNVITVAQLRTANLLPPSWAARDTGDGTTPIGSTFVAYSIKGSGATPTQTVITESGNASLARLESLGFPQPDATNAVPGLLDIKRQVASRLWDAGIPAGTLDAGTLTVAGAGSNGWTRGVNAWFVSAAQQPFVVGMLGFPELEPPTTVNDPRGAGANHGECRAINGQGGKTPANMAGWVQPTCPTSHPVQVTDWPVCGPEGYQYDSDFVDIRAGIKKREDDGNAINDSCTSNVSGSRSPPCDNDLQNYSTYQHYDAGTTTVVQNVCATAVYYDYNPPGNLYGYWPMQRVWSLNARNLYCCQR